MNLIGQYEHDLKQRVRAGELTESSKDTYMNDAAKILEALVGLLPVVVIEAYIKEWGAGGDYGTAIRRLKKTAQKRRNIGER